MTPEQQSALDEYRSPTTIEGERAAVERLRAVGAPEPYGPEILAWPAARPAMKPVAIDQSGIEIHSVDGIYLKQYRFPDAGTIVPQHAHVWGHLTLVAVGSLYAWADSKYLGKFEAPTGIEIAAGIKHTFQTIEPGTVIYCCHNLKSADKVAVLAEHHLDFGDG